MKKIIWWIPVILMMGLIFWFSSKTAEESDRTSNPIAVAIVEIGESCFGTLSQEKHEIWLGRMNFVVRKTAHVTEYLILTLLFGLAFVKTFVGKSKLLILLVTLIAPLCHAAKAASHLLM